jgi:trans-aconitate methyltransferase
MGENRAFLRRAVQYLVGAGVRQFLDIGAGLPTQGNVHEVVHRVAPEARVAYVDNDPVVVAHGRALLAKSPQVRIAQADLREPAQLLQQRVVREHLDFDRPVAVLLVAILHFIADHEDPAGIVAQLREALPAGSYLVVSHGIGETRPQAADAAEAVYNTASAQLTLRSYADLQSFFKGFELVEPGLVDVTEWHPDWVADPATIAAGVGRKI